ncbi:DoxX family protein [Streptomyces sp. NPDC090106]|uniref:DoxX family protein n=1 Tax=Streptomyces sp. NPDC090106 TaxID=3365946 RepID=UPI0037F46055
MGDLDCRSTSLPPDPDPYAVAVRHGPVEATDHPVASLPGERHARFPNGFSGIGFGVVGGFEKTWSSFPLDDPKPPFEPVDALPSLPAAAAGGLGRPAPSERLLRITAAAMTDDPLSLPAASATSSSPATGGAPRWSPRCRCRTAAEASARLSGTHPHHRLTGPAPGRTRRRKTLMNIALWIVAGVLGAASLAGGAMKLAQPREKLAASDWGWVEDFDPGTVKFIGALEVLAGLGLILPAALDLAPALVPLAATGLVLLMIGAGLTHHRRHEIQSIAVNAALLAVAAFVAWGRFGPYSF